MSDVVSARQKIFGDIAATYNLLQNNIYHNYNNLNCQLSQLLGKKADLEATAYKFDLLNSNELMKNGKNGETMKVIATNLHEGVEEFSASLQEISEKLAVLIHPEDILRQIQLTTSNMTAMVNISTAKMLDVQLNEPIKQDVKKLYKSRRHTDPDTEFRTITIEADAGSPLSIDVITQQNGFGGVGESYHLIHQITKGGRYFPCDHRLSDKLIGINGRPVFEFNEQQIQHVIRKEVETGRVVLDVANHSLFARYRPRVFGSQQPKPIPAMGNEFDIGFGAGFKRRTRAFGDFGETTETITWAPIQANVPNTDKPENAPKLENNDEHAVNKIDKVDVKELYKSRRNESLPYNELHTFTIETVKDTPLKIHLESCASNLEYIHFIDKITQGENEISCGVQLDDKLIGINGRYVADMNGKELQAVLERETTTDIVVLDIARRCRNESKKEKRTMDPTGIQELMIDDQIEHVAEIHDVNNNNDKTTTLVLTSSAESKIVEKENNNSENSQVDDSLRSQESNQETVASVINEKEDKAQTAVEPKTEDQQLTGQTSEGWWFEILLVMIAAIVNIMILYYV